MSKLRDVKRYPGLGALSVAFFLYLYAPLLVVVVFSFNANRITGVWSHFSLKWYGSALNNRPLMSALETSLIVAAVATVVATTIALLAALAIIRGKNVRFRKLSETVVNLPLLLPEIVLAVATLILFSLISLQNGMLKLIIALRPSARPSPSCRSALGCRACRWISKRPQPIFTPPAGRSFAALRCR